MKIKVYAVLNEDRGGDTDVTLHSTYEDAKKEFNQAVSEIRERVDEVRSRVEGNDYWEFELCDDTLGYEIDESWGSIAIYSEELEFDLHTNKKDKQKKEISNG